MVLPYHLAHWKSEDEKIIVFNCHYEELFRVSEDKTYNLSLVDPPYGIDAGNIFSSAEKRKSGKGVAKKSKFRQGDWDKEIPPPEYYEELFRVSEDQIIWGANYMTENLPNSQGWIIWDKNNGTTNFADGELAFTSFDRAIRIFKYTWNGMLQGDMKNKEIRIHPTQKPVALYRWCLMNYAETGFKILDTHLGSGNICIAVDSLNKIEGMNLSIVACEKDELIFNDAILNIKAGILKTPDFRYEEEKPEIIQQKLFTEE